MTILDLHGQNAVALTAHARACLQLDNKQNKENNYSFTYFYLKQTNKQTQNIP